MGTRLRNPPSGIGQYLKTKEHIDCYGTAIDKQYEPEVIRELRKVEPTIKLRELY